MVWYLWNGSPRSGLCCQCRLYPYSVAGMYARCSVVLQECYITALCHYFLLHTQVDIHKVFEDPIVTKVNVSQNCRHARKAKADELWLMLRHFTTVHVRYVCVTNKSS